MEKKKYKLNNNNNIFEQEEKKSIRCIYKIQENNQYVIYIPYKVIKKIIKVRHNDDDQLQEKNNIFTLCISKDCYNDEIQKNNCDKAIHVNKWYFQFLITVGFYHHSINDNNKEFNVCEYYNQYIKRNKEENGNIIMYDKNYIFELYDEHKKLHKIKLIDIDITLGFHEYIYYYRKKDPTYGRRICNLYEETNGRCKYGWNCLDIHIRKKKSIYEKKYGIKKHETIEKNKCSNGIVKQNILINKNVINKVERTYASVVVQNNTICELNDIKIYQEDEKNNKKFFDTLSNDFIINIDDNEENNNNKNNAILKKNNDNNNNNNYENDIVININVGGITYQTLLSTLRKCTQSDLYYMFSKENIKNIPKDKKGNYFIDRNGNIFHYILEYLRNYNLYKNDLDQFKIMIKKDFFAFEKVIKELIYFKLIGTF